MTEKIYDQREDLHRLNKTRRAVDSTNLVCCLKDGCLEIEREVTLGGKIGWQDRKWHLFNESGDSGNMGADSLFSLIISLAPNAS